MDPRDDKRGCNAIGVFERRLVAGGIIGYGVSSFGYDLRAAPDRKG